MVTMRARATARGMVRFGAYDDVDDVDDDVLRGQWTAWSVKLVGAALVRARMSSQLELAGACARGLRRMLACAAIRSRAGRARLPRSVATRDARLHVMRELVELGLRLHYQYRVSLSVPVERYCRQLRSVIPPVARRLRIVYVYDFDHHAASLTTHRQCVASSECVVAVGASDHAYRSSYRYHQRFVVRNNRLVSLSSTRLCGCGTA